MNRRDFFRTTAAVAAANAVPSVAQDYVVRWTWSTREAAAGHCKFTLYYKSGRVATAMLPVASDDLQGEFYARVLQ